MRLIVFEGYNDLQFFKSLLTKSMGFKEMKLRVSRLAPPVVIESDKTIQPALN